MAQKLDKRLEGEGYDIEDVVEYDCNYGITQACFKYNAKYMAMMRLLRERTKNENAGKNPKYKPLTNASGKTVVEEAMERIEHWIKNKEITLEKRIKEQDEYIELLEIELENYRRRQADDLETGLIKVMEACEV